MIDQLTLGGTEVAPTCVRCGVTKTSDDFEKTEVSHRRVCRTCVEAARVTWVKAHPENRLKANRKWRRTHAQDWHTIKLAAYGLTAEDYERILRSQNGTCALCHEVCKTGRRLCVDHDHKTGVVRGLLCHNCNSGLGQLGDNIEGLRNAIAYLEKGLPSGF